MSHEIDETNGPTIAFVGEKPWHGLGTELPEGADIDTWRRAAKLEWRVQESPVSFERRLYRHGSDAEIATVQFPNRKALYRGDNGASLSIVSDIFQVVQPGEVLEFFRNLCEKHGFKMETAGALRGGRKIWALARIAEGFRVVDDVVLPYVLLSTAYDATMATWARLCTTRVVCANTIAVAEDERGNIVRVPHNAKLDFEDVRLQLGLAIGAWERFKVRALKLAQRDYSEVEAAEFLRQLLGIEGDETPRGFGRILELFKGAQLGADKKSTRQTLWGVVQAVAEHVDHNPYSKSDDTRLDAAWFGYGNDLKIKAFKKALSIVEPKAPSNEDGKEVRVAA